MYAQVVIQERSLHTVSCSGQGQNPLLIMAHAHLSLSSWRPQCTAPLDAAEHPTAHSPLHSLLHHHCGRCSLCTPIKHLCMIPSPGLIPQLSALCACWVVLYPCTFSTIATTQVPNLPPVTFSSIPAPETYIGSTRHNYMQVLGDIQCIYHNRSLSAPSRTQYWYVNGTCALLKGGARWQ